MAALVLPATPARATDGPCDGRWRSQHDVARGIRCVWTRFNVGRGGARKALDVARCESGLNPEADGGTYEGLFQHSSRYWRERYANLIEHHRLRRSWDLPKTVFDGRTNSIVTALMVRRNGWGAWSCA